MGQQQTSHSGARHSSRVQTSTQGATTHKDYEAKSCELEEITITCEHNLEEEHSEKSGKPKPGEGERPKSEGGKPKAEGGGKRIAEKQKDGTLLLEVCANGGIEPEEAGAGITAKPIPGSLPGLTLIRGIPGVGDHLILKAEAKLHCKQHPIWVIAEVGGKSETTPPQMNVTQKFVSRQDLGQKGILGIFWLRSVRPRIYKITCTAHNGTKKAEIHAYPTVESKLEIDTREHGGSRWAEYLDTLREAVKKVFKIVEEWAPAGTELKLKKLLEGSLYLTNYWTEDKASYKAHWQGELGINMVFLDMDVELPIPNPAFLASRAIKFFQRFGVDFEVGLFFGFGGEISANPHFEWTNNDVEIKSGDLSTEVTLSLIAKTEFGWRGNVLQVHMDIHTKATAKCTPKMTMEPQVEVKSILNWQPFGGRIEVKLRRQILKRHLWHPGTWIHPAHETREYDLVNANVEFFKAQEFELGTFHLLPQKS